MIEWRDEGLVLSSRPLGETTAILDVLTATRGRHAGAVRGGLGRRMRPLLQRGNVLDVAWRARLDAHMGAFTVEAVRTGGPWMNDRRALAALNSVAALLILALAERDPHPGLYRLTRGLLDELARPDWPAAYLRWELGLLVALGYGPDLATGGELPEEAAPVPPAGTRGGSLRQPNTLLPVSGRTGGADGPGEVLAGLRATGQFLRHALAQLVDRPLPPARERLLDELARM